MKFAVELHGTLTMETRGDAPWMASHMQGEIERLLWGRIGPDIEIVDADISVDAEETPDD